MATLQAGFDIRGIVTDVPPRLRCFVLLPTAHDVYRRRDGRQGRGPCMFTTSRDRKVWWCGAAEELKGGWR